MTPDLKGEWIADTVGISIGDSKTEGSVDAATLPTIVHNRVVMTIDFQDGTLVAGIKKHKYGEDRFVGVIRSDCRSMVAADAEGDMHARLIDENHMEICYTEHSSSRAFATCEIYIRQH